jgi:protein TonB
MPGYFNSLVISLTLHALVVIPVASVLLATGDGATPPGKPLQISVVNRSIEPSKPNSEVRSEKIPVSDDLPPVIQEQNLSNTDTSESQARKVSTQALKPVKPQQTLQVAAKPVSSKPWIVKQPAPAKSQQPDSINPSTVAKPQPVPQTPTAPPIQLASIVPDSPAVNTDHKAILDRYRSKLLDSIMAAKRYPLRARRKGIEGETMVTFSVLKGGQIVDIGILEHSGHRILDKAALETLERIGRLDPIPFEFAKDRWDFKIPIRFQLL